MWKSIAAALYLLLTATGCSLDAPAQSPHYAPEFVGIDRWFNSPSLSMAKLRGSVVLVEFWTYECINCAHVQPHLKDAESYHPDLLKPVTDL